VILYGPVGVGKTHIAQALGHLAIRHGADVRFTKTSCVLADLAGGHADGTWTRRLRELVRPPVLILDDFGMRELTARQADDLYELINERTGRSPVLTSNRLPVDWYPLRGNGLSAWASTAWNTDIGAAPPSGGTAALRPPPGTTARLAPAGAPTR
jgi:DNA replication protein DnaC